MWYLHYMSVDLSVLVRRFEPLADDDPNKHAQIHAINPRFYYGKYTEHQEADEFVQNLPHGTGNHTVVRALLVYKELMRALQAGEIQLDEDGKLRLPGETSAQDGQGQLQLGDNIQDLVAAEVQKQLRQVKPRGRSARS